MRTCLVAICIEYDGFRNARYGKQHFKTIESRRQLSYACWFLSTLPRRCKIIVRSTRLRNIWLRGSKSTHRATKSRGILAAKGSFRPTEQFVRPSKWPQKQFTFLSGPRYSFISYVRGSLSRYTTVFLARHRYIIAQ